MRRAAHFAVILVLLLGFARAKSGVEREQYLDDQAEPLFAQSAFARGYLHGYEDGFHSGDQDYQLSQIQPPTERLKQMRHLGSSALGSDRKSFQNGYARGFEAGYADNVAGRSFRAITAIRAAAEDLEMPLPPRVLKGAMAFVPMSATGGSGEFDQAFAAGYEAGLEYTQKNSRPIRDSSYVMSVCMAGDLGKVGPSYCDAYSRGFNLGYDDGQALRAK
jgi:hypothetical protein